MVALVCTAPDLAVVRAEGTIAIEVELTAKAPQRLQAIIWAWRRAIGAELLSEVHYLCAPGQARAAVERAVSTVRAEKFIAIGEAAAR